jgi:hypothetical protein
MKEGAAVAAASSAPTAGDDLARALARCWLGMRHRRQAANCRGCGLFGFCERGGIAAKCHGSRCLGDGLLNLSTLVLYLAAAAFHAKAGQAVAHSVYVSNISLQTKGESQSTDGRAGRRVRRGVAVIFQQDNAAIGISAASFGACAALQAVHFSDSDTSSIQANSRVNQAPRVQSRDLNAASGSSTDKTPSRHSNDSGRGAQLHVFAVRMSGNVDGGALTIFISRA